jgi:hypothetical protein
MRSPGFSLPLSWASPISWQSPIHVIPHRFYALELAIAMKSYFALTTVIALVAAVPSPNNDGVSNAISSTSTVANCQPNVSYCFEQIVQDLGTSTFVPHMWFDNADEMQGVPKQTILHQYCDQEFEYDALSCHACHKFPWPLDYCWDGPGAWNSVFTCKSGNEYVFKERCDWCEAGMCV